VASGVLHRSGFRGTLFGLAERGKFVYTTQAVTAVTLYRIPVNELKPALLEDGHLQFQFLVKATHEFREVQRQKVALTRRDAVGKVATLFSMLERQAGDVGVADTVAVPVTRSDIADFLGPSPEAVSRATREITRRRLRCDSRSAYCPDSGSHPLRSPGLQDLAHFSRAAGNLDRNQHGYARVSPRLMVVISSAVS
jgi:Crp-like helix-turn-helix domain